MSDTSNKNDFVRSSPVRKKENHKISHNPPSPRRVAADLHQEIPWGDRKPAAKTLIIDDREPVAKTIKHTCIDYDSDDAYGGVSEHDIEIEMKDYQTKTKSGVLFPRNSPKKPKPAGFPGTEKEGDQIFGSKSLKENPSAGTRKSKPNEDLSGETDEKDIGSDKMSKRELFLAAVVSAAIVVLTLMITFIVISRQTRNGMMENNISANQGDKNSNGDDTTPVPIGAEQNLPPSTNGGNNGLIGTGEFSKITVREEWELVYSALRDNDVARVLLKGRDATEDALPYDIYFYKDLISGMVFSEVERDWIVVPHHYDDITNTEVEFTDMSMAGAIGDYGDKGSGDENNNSRFSIARKLTPNQKATAWLLFHDDLKDPNESVWRWAMASIYFKMGGENWKFENNANKWFTNEPICEWERLVGSSGCDKHKQPIGTPLLPVELDFDNANMVGTIAVEFSLLLLPAGSFVSAASNDASPTNTLVRSITLTDNRLIGTIPGAVFHHLMPALGKLYLDSNQLTGTIPLQLGGLDTLYVQNNAFSGNWPEKFCGSGMETVDDFGLDCEKVHCTCCDIHQCYYSGL